MRIAFKLFILFLGLSALSSQAGVSLGGSRFIYPADRKEISVQVNNPDKDTDYLLQSWLENENSNNTAKVPFVVTPPLFRLDRESGHSLRIASAGTQLPTDRETLYWLNVKAIPGTPKVQKGNQLQIVARTRVKFIYRPTSLAKEGAAEAYKKLTFSHDGDQLLIKNPTPYYVSFYSLKVGGTAVEMPGMVAPFSEHRVKVSGKGQIEWQSINDYGGFSETARQ
ncbi:fimbria/pilus periplasmic chaperone (plasmid) [Enterobacteriaceae bacterium Kacie_13]|nr:fimbria/pilus periplasmic chaperone [Enterobacteriaceae bacterium Kacie_13]